MLRTHELLSCIKNIDLYRIPERNPINSVNSSRFLETRTLECTLITIYNHLEIYFEGFCIIV